MNGRKLYGAIYAGEPVDSLPIVGIGGWTEAVERWRREGLGPNEDPNCALGLVSADTAGLPLNLNMVPAFDLKILEKTNDYVTLVDEYGVTKKMLCADFDRTQGRQSSAGAPSSMSQWLDYPVKDMRSWKAIFEERFRPTLEGRIWDDWDARKVEFRAHSATRWVMHFNFPFGGLFSAVRELMGLEGTAYAMADQPRLVKTIADDLGRFYLECFALVLPDVRLDQIICFEDMCSNHAPLVGPEMFREFFAPAYRKYIGGLKELGVKQVFVDTDGDARLIISELMTCGFTGIHPCEIKAGMDPGALRRQYPTLCCNAGIDKIAVARGGTAMEKEFERRFRVAWDLGRFTPGLDHSAPPDISWQNLQQYAKLFLAWCASPTGPYGR